MIHPAEKIAATKPCSCGALPSVEVDDVSGGCFIECVNKSCKAHLTVAHGGGRDNAIQAWNAAALAKDVAAMEEALSKLPRTADGVAIVPGTRVWYVREGLEPEAHVIRGYEYESSTVIAPDGYANGCVFFSPSGSTSIWRWDQCYSTPDAALAAAAKGQGTVTT